MNTVKRSFGIVGLALAFLVIGCSPTPAQLKKILKDNPDILTETFEAHPFKMTQAMMKAHQSAQKESREQAEKEEKETREAEFKSPKSPEIAKERAVLGNPNAAVTVVEYSDFQCPYCRRGFQTVKELEKKYGDKIRIVFKHLPLEFHPLAMPAAKRFEAIVMQNPKKAYEFHDLVFDKQGEMKDEKFLDDMAKKAGVDLAKMKKDMESDRVKTTIQSDMDEAQKFGITGTPGFIVGGISLKGAYPTPAFEEIIDRRLKETGTN
jgi:protein-disulfide isomerase